MKTKAILWILPLLLVFFVFMFEIDDEFFAQLGVGQDSEDNSQVTLDAIISGTPHPTSLAVSSSASSPIHPITHAPSLLLKETPISSLPSTSPDPMRIRNSLLNDDISTDFFYNVSTRPTNKAQFAAFLQTNASIQSIIQTGLHSEWRLALKNWTHYPLAIEDWARGYHPGTETNCGFAGLFARLEKGEKITIGVYGGSQSFGAKCTTSWKGFERECAWPKRVESWFR
jgi:hypothetical protein